MSRHMTDRERHRDEQAQWFGDNVRKRREQKQMSQGDVAREMTQRGWAWHQSTVYKVEHGTRRTEAFEVADLAAILGVPMDHLFWPPAEVNEVGLVDRAIGILHREWGEAVLAVQRLLAARDLAEHTLAQSGDSKYERVRAVCAELAAELEDRTLQNAADEGYARHVQPEEEP